MRYTQKVSAKELITFNINIKHYFSLNRNLHRQCSPNSTFTFNNLYNNFLYDQTGHFTFKENNILCESCLQC